jgi:hypothetical protein
MSNKIPITRLNKFFSDEDYDLEMKMGQEYLHGDLGFKLVLFRVDRAASQTDDVYGEAQKDEIKFHPPVEFYGLVEIEEPKNKDMKGGMLRYLQPGNMTVSVYKHHLEELGVDVMYGDYIGYIESESKIRYYTVVNDGKVTSDNEHTYGGFKAFYRTIICTPVQDSEFGKAL